MRKTSPRIVFSSSWSRVRQALEDDEWQSNGRQGPPSGPYKGNCGQL